MRAQRLEQRGLHPLPGLRLELGPVEPGAELVEPGPASRPLGELVGERGLAGRGVRLAEQPRGAREFAERGVVRAERLRGQRRAGLPVPVDVVVERGEHVRDLGIQRRGPLPGFRGEGGARRPVPPVAGKRRGDAGGGRQARQRLAIGLEPAQRGP